MRILALDIETKFITAGVWGLWDQNVGLNQILDSGGILCWSAKYIGQKQMHFRREGDKLFLKELHQLMSDADALLSYNGDRFDIRRINTEFLKAGLPMPAPARSIDLLKTIKKRFSFPSNKLQHVSTELGIGSKIDHEGFPLWIKCVNGDEKAWKKMEAYCRQDVTLLEKLYNRVQGWVANHPSHSLETEARICPTCGSNHMQRRGYHVTKTARYNRLACLKCGSWSRERKTEVPKDSDILVSL